MSKVGLIGLGLLGSALAERLLAAGFEVSGFDIAPQRRAKLEAAGGRAVSSPLELPALCPRMVFCLPDSQVVSEVLRQLAPHLGKGSILVDTTTGDPEQMAGFARMLTEQGVDYLDAAVSGSSRQVAEGDAVVMVGGPRPVFEDCTDVFATFARRAFYAGPSGAGARMKLIVNLVLGLNRAVLAEGLSFAAACGVQPAAALEAMKAGPAYSRVMDLKGERMLRRQYEPEARLAQHLKDVRLILQQAERSGCALPLSTLHETLLAAAESAGFGDCDNRAIIEAFARLSTPESRRDG